MEEFVSYYPTGLNLSSTTLLPEFVDRESRRGISLYYLPNGTCLLFCGQAVHFLEQSKYADTRC